MYARILVPVDGSPTASRGLAEAMQLAKVVGARLRLLHVVNELVLAPMYGAGIETGKVIDSMRSYGQSVLQEAEKKAREQGLQCDAVMIESVGGLAGDIIVQQAAEWQAELIALGTHGRRGLRRVVLGSDAEHVVRNAAVPVLLVRSV